MKTPLTQALVLFFGVTVATFLLLVSTSEAEQATSAVASVSVLEPPGTIRGDVDRAFEEALVLLDRERGVLETQTFKSITTQLKQTLSVWETNPQQREALRLDLRTELEGFRVKAGLDLVSLVTQDDGVILAVAGTDAPDLEGRALVRSAFTTLAEPYFREGKSSNSFEKLPLAPVVKPESGTTAPASGQGLYLVAGAPVWIRPDAPAAVLVGALSLESFAPRVDLAWKKSNQGKVRWQAFVDELDAGARVVAGVGLGRPVRPELCSAILNDKTSTEPAFENEKFAPGRWRALHNRSGVLLGGWGVTANPEGLRKVVATTPAVAADPWPWLPVREHLTRHGMWYALGAGLCLCLVAGAALIRSSRKKRRHFNPRTTLPPAEQFQPIVPRPHVPAPASDSLVSQFEINWKTFASYTQDLLQQKLRELEDAPVRGVKEVREQVAKLNQALTEIKTDLASARNEARDTTRGVVEQVASLVEQEAQKKNAGDMGETVLRKIETDFDRATARFAQLDDTVDKLSNLFTQKQNSAIEERVTAEVERIEAQWNERVRQFGQEIEEAKIQGQSLLVDLEKARGIEVALREELQRAGASCDELAKRLADKTLELEAVVRDREIAWKRERDAQEQISLLKLGEVESRDRIMALEGSILQLEKSASSSREREEAATREARQAITDAESLRAQLLGSQRDAQHLHADAVRKEREHEEERSKLSERNRTLSGLVGALNGQMSEAQAELERLRSLVANREDELALRDKTLTATQAENARLGSEVELLTTDVKKDRHALANAQQSIELLRLELDDSTQRLRQNEGELEQLRKNSAQAIAELAASRAAQADGERQNRLEKEALEKAVEASLSEVKRLRAVEEELPRLRTQLAELEHLRRSRGEFGETAARLQAFEKERKELLESLDRMNRDLERTRTEADGIRCLQDALVDGSLPAAIIAFDTAQKVFAWNSRAEGLWGRSSTAAIGSRLSTLGLKGIEKEASAFATRSMTEKTTVQLPQCSFSDHTGKMRHLRLWCDPIRGPRGEVLGGVLVAEEITEKVEHEIEARLQALFSQSLAKSLPGALVVLDTQSRVISWNRNAESILGLTETQALGESFFALSTPLAKDGFRRHFDTVTRDQRPHRVRVRFDHAGVPTQFLVTQAPFLGNDDAVRGTILLIQEAHEPAEARR